MNILIAEDEKDLRELLKLLLIKEGYHVYDAFDGLVALEVFLKHSIDLAILDVMMPKLDGFNLLRKIRETSEIPVIFLTARGEDMDKILGLGLGADDYMIKHFTMDPVFQGIGYTWNRYSRNGSLYYDKKGETINFYSRIIIYPEQKTGVFISFNTPPPMRSLEGISNKVTEHLLGSEKEQEFYNGKALNDISGYYVLTWSTFNQPEKFLNIVIPERTIHITGSIAEGFQLDGEAFIPVGKDYYRSKLGYVKFIEKEGKAYLSSNTSSSYLRTSWYEYRGWQTLVVVFFIGFSSVGFIVSSIYLLLSLKEEKTSECNPGNTCNSTRNRPLPPFCFHV
ncbi:hypothetical protein JCM17380_29760 [Desulfosporosinus burensis]